MYLQRTCLYELWYSYTNTPCTHTNSYLRSVIKNNFIQHATNLLPRYIILNLILIVIKSLEAVSSRLTVKMF